jgi:hypothetical protein
MDQMMKSLATPQWMLDLFKAIDALDMSPTSGFAIFAEVGMLRSRARATCYC